MKRFLLIFIIGFIDFSVKAMVPIEETLVKVYLKRKGNEKALKLKTQLNSSIITVNENFSKTDEQSLLRSEENKDRQLIRSILR